MACPTVGDQQCRTGKAIPMYHQFWAGPSVPGLGLPLGGIGGGSFMLNQCGTFGPWNMGGPPTLESWEQRTRTQAAFHVREEMAGTRALVKTLAVPHNNIAPDRRLGTVLPAWSTLNAGDGTYAVLFPFAWMNYTSFQAKISTKIWSPIIANEDERSSMPLTFFDMLFDRNAASGFCGVTLGADSPENTPDTVRSEWTIAAHPSAGQQLTFCTSWNAAGDGSDIYSAFSSLATGGELPNGQIDKSASAGAIAISLTLKPGQMQTVRFALSWDFPQVYNESHDRKSRAVWMRRYTAFLGGKQTASNDYIAGSYPFKQGFEIAKKELARYDKSLADVEAWWRPIAENPKVPVWLRQASLNELYHIIFNGSFWESGLVSNTMPMSIADGTLPRLGSAAPSDKLFADDAGDPFRDCPPKLIYRTYALIKFYDDEELLKYGYAPMVKALEYAQFFRPSGSHLPMDPPSNNPPNSMDQAVVNGHGFYNCGLYLLSLQILSTLTPLAVKLGIVEATAEKQSALDHELALAKEEFETKFWNPSTGRYRYCDGIGGIDDRSGTIFNLFKPVPPPDSIWLDAFIRFRDPEGRLMGGPIILKPDFSIYPSSLNTTAVNEVIPGIAWLAAAAAVRIGTKVGDKSIVEKALKLGEGCAIRIYDEKSGLAFNSPESWFVDDISVTRFPGYTRTRSVWSLYDAVDRISVGQPS